MTLFELYYLALQPVYSPLHRRVRRELLTIAEGNPGMDILDVGGRKSHYTIGVPANIHVSDLPRDTEIQKSLNLGVTEAIIRQTLSRRSNVRRVIFDDMTKSTLPANSFDCVVAVEVLEHVEKDRDFVREVSRVLKPGGYFLMTTPNGDFVKNTNPDHKRHYKRAELAGLLGGEFESANVVYAICGGTSRRLGLKGWRLSAPWQTLLSMIGNTINGIISNKPQVAEMAKGTHHLLALSQKSGRA